VPGFVLQLVERSAGWLGADALKVKAHCTNADAHATTKPYTPCLIDKSGPLFI